MTTDTAFALGLITSALQWIFVMLSWILTTYIGRRTIYLWGSAVNVLLLICLGIAASVGASHAATLAQAALGLIVSVLFTLGPAPASWVIIGETSSIRLRPLTTGIGRACYYIVEIPCIFLASYMLNPTVSFDTCILPKLTNIRRVETLVVNVVMSGVELVWSA
jgi:SP family general alpha glucoside:H+ symporter-like MFS transporter